MLAGSKLPPVFLTRLVSALVKSRVLAGTIEGGYYIPEAYVIERQASIVDELRRDGLIGILNLMGAYACFRCFADLTRDYCILATETLRKEGIRNPEQFIRDKVPSARLLGSHFVTADFIANIEGLVLNNIERQMWSDMQVRKKPSPLCLPRICFDPYFVLSTPCCFSQTSRLN